MICSSVNLLFRIPGSFLSRKFTRPVWQVYAGPVFGGTVRKRDAYGETAEEQKHKWGSASHDKLPFLHPLRTVLGRFWTAGRIISATYIGKGIHAGARPA